MGEPSPLTCFTCKQEVRWGWRHGRKAWWHREDVDHAVILGEGSTPELHAQLAEADKARAAAKAKGKKKDAEDDVEEMTWPTELPEPEVRCTPVERNDPRVPGGAKTILNLLEKEDWELRRLTYARGPYIGANGKILSISDSIVLGAVDGEDSAIVAFWRDGKFNGAMTVFKHQLEGRPNATELKNWIKGTTS